MDVVLSEKKTIRESRVHREQKPPDGSKSWKEFASGIDLYPEVDKDLLYRNDADPFHVVLDVLELDAISENGLIYDSELVNAIESQLPGTGGNMGHDNPADESFVYREMQVHWVGHKRVGQKTYAKGYIPPGETREFVRRLLATGGKLRTSIVGSGVYQEVGEGTYRLLEYEHEKLDFAPANRAALRKYQSGQAVISREMKQPEITPTEGKPMTEITAADVPQAIREQIIAEASEMNELRQKATRVTELEAQITSLQSEVQEMRQYAVLVAEIRTMLPAEADVAETMRGYHEAITQLVNTLGVGSYSDICVKVEEMHSVVQELTRKQHAAAIESAASRLTNWNVTAPAHKQAVAALRNAVAKRLQSELVNVPVDQIDAEADRIWTAEFAELARVTISQIAGPVAFVAPAAVTESQRPLQLTEDRQKAILAKFNKA